MRRNQIGAFPENEYSLIETVYSDENDNQMETAYQIGKMDINEHKVVILHENRYGRWEKYSVEGDGDDEKRKIYDIQPAISEKGYKGLEFPFLYTEESVFNPSSPIRKIKSYIHILHKLTKDELEKAFGTVELTKHTKMYHADNSGSDWFVDSPIKGPAFFACDSSETDSFGSTKLSFFNRKSCKLLDLINDERTRPIKLGFEPYGRSLLRICIYGSILHHGQINYEEDRDARYLKSIGVEGWFSYDHGIVANGEIMLCNPQENLSLFSVAINNRNNKSYIEYKDAQ